MALARENVGRHCAGGAGADVGEVAVVEEQRGRKARGGVEERNHARTAREAARRVVVEPRGHLDRDVRHAVDVRGLDVELAAGRGDLEVDDRGHVGASLAVGAERVADHRHRQPPA